jgi:hypothetical protein
MPLWIFWLLTAIGAIGSLSSIAGLVLAVYVLRRERVIQSEVETLAHDEDERYGKG